MLNECLLDINMNLLLNNNNSIKEQFFPTLYRLKIRPGVVCLS